MLKSFDQFQYEIQTSAALIIDLGFYRCLEGFRQSLARRPGIKIETEFTEQYFEDFILSEGNFFNAVF